MNPPSLPHHRLQVWQLALELVRLVHQVRIADADDRQQARKAASSCARNIAEAVVYSSNFGAPNDQNIGPNDGIAVGSSRTEGRARGMDQATGRPGDVIVGVNGKPVRRLGDFIQELERVGVGKRVTLAIKRDGRDMSVDVDVIDVGRRT